MFIRSLTLLDQFIMDGQVIVDTPIYGDNWYNDWYLDG